MKIQNSVATKLLVLVALLAFANTSPAPIAGPYTFDANTLHLWHIDETVLNVADDPSVGTPVALTSLGSGGGNALGAASFPSPSFGNAYSGVKTLSTGLYAKAPVNGSGDDTSFATFKNATTGAFTYEMMMRADFDPTAANADYVMLMAMDQDSGTRPFFFALNPQGTVGETYRMQMFSTANSTIELATDVPITQDHWYHLALAYDGNEGAASNLKIYWTDMGTQATPDYSAQVANLLGSLTLTADLTGTAGDLSFGAEARNGGGSTGQWLGLIDEVRVSDIARGADQFIFIPEPSSLTLGALGMALLGFKLRRQRRVQ